MSLLRDQARACLAYTLVMRVSLETRKDYRIAVNDFGNNLRRMGLATTLSVLESDNSGGKLLLQHLAEAQVEGLGNDPKTLPSRARDIDDLARYMLATRELLRLAEWFKRAVQATFSEDSHAQ